LSIAIQDLFDVIVVGAGPAGSNAASVCLRQGLTVVQLDSRMFPRNKPCAGGLTPKSLPPLQFDWEGRLCSWTREFEFSGTGGIRLRFRHSGPFLRFIQRTEFDHSLVASNLGKPGFRFMPETPACAMFHDGCFCVETPNGEVKGRQLIGADGANGLTRRHFCGSSPRLNAAALEVDLPLSSSLDGDTVMAARFDFGVVERGYGWVFPKGDHASVGLYTLANALPGLRSSLKAYAVGQGLEWPEFPVLRGHKYPVGGGILQKSRIPVYLVGDAAGLAEAVTGEGIYPALESGRLAGEVAVAVACRGADPRLFWRRTRGLRRDAALSRMLARVFYRNPDRWLRLMGNTPLWRVLVEGYADGHTLSGLTVRAPALLLTSWFHRRAGITQTDNPAS